MRMDSLDVCGDEIWFECETDTRNVNHSHVMKTYTKCLENKGIVGCFNPPLDHGPPCHIITTTEITPSLMQKTA